MVFRASSIHKRFTPQNFIFIVSHYLKTASRSCASTYKLTVYFTNSTLQHVTTLRRHLHMTHLQLCLVVASLFRDYKQHAMFTYNHQLMGVSCIFSIFHTIAFSALSSALTKICSTYHKFPKNSMQIK